MDLRRLPWRAACVVLLLMAGAACGDATSADDPPEADPAPTTPVEVTEGEVVVSCGGGDGWPPSVMADGMPGLLSDADARRTFQEILEDPKWGAEAELSLFSQGIDVDYRVLRGDEASLTLGLGHWTEEGPASTDTYVLGLAREGERWIPDGWGSCTNLGPVLRDGLAWARVESYAAGDTADSLTLSVSETMCTSARDPRPFLHDPVVVESEDAVTIYSTTTPMRGGADCQGNPSAELDIVLDRPLGGRPVVDGSFFPARPVSRSQR